MPTKLKSLELHGFKTFANQILFEFPGSITCVVGPNGSGKSNVADAIRWVLGEQSFFLLRGRKTEDLIFAGSEQRTRAGMAEATIIFNNEDGWLPIDYSEVSITRRAYRDGDNEYLLNGQRVRLKDIYELLAKSGLGQRTYTIIGQGLVDAALSLKPDERRQFFEEAAGIGLYRKRRQEALDRLEATQKNLTRILDIIGELGPQLRVLERQARKTAEYQRIKEDLNILLKEWYGYHWHRAQEEYQHAREVLIVQEERLAKSREKTQDVAALLDAVKSKMTVQRLELGTWQKELSTVYSKRESINKELAVISERETSLLKQFQEAKIERSRWEEEEKGAGETLGKQAIELDSLTVELSEVRERLSVIQTEYDKKQAERNILEKEIDTLRKQLTIQEMQLVKREAALEELKNRVSEDGETIQHLTKNMESDEQEKKALEEKLRLVDRDKKSFDEKLASFQKEKSDIKLRVATLEQKIAALQKTRNDLENELSRLNSRRDLILQQESSLSGLSNGIRFLVTSFKQGKIKGNYFPLGSVIETNKEYEVAIAAVLGEFLDSIIVEEGVDYERIIDIMSDGDHGRALVMSSNYQDDTFVDLSIWKNDVRVINLASELVSCTNGLDALIHQLLRNVLVVKDKKIAMALLSQLPKGAKIVTLNGDLFGTNGILYTGKVGKEDVLSRKRQIKDIEKAIWDCQNRKQAVEQEMDTAQLSFEELSSAVTNLDEKISSCLNSSQEIESHIRDLSFLKQQKVNEIKLRYDQIQSLKQRLLKNNELIQQNQKEKSLIVSTSLELEKKLAEKSKQIQEFSLRDLRTELTHWQTKSAVLVQAKNDAQKRFSDQQKQLSVIQDRMQFTQARLNSLETSIKEVVNTKTNLLKSEEEIRESIQTFRQRSSPLEKELEELEKQASQLQENLLAVQQGQTIAERYFTQAQMDVTRQKEALENLRRRIEDDFGLVAFEYQPDIEGPTPLPFDGMVAQLKHVEKIDPEIEDNIIRQRTALRRMGAINPDAEKEYIALQERFEFLTDQVADLKKADEDLRKVIAELDELMKQEFQKTFNAVAVQFRQMFTRLFGGGYAKLMLVDDENPISAGIEIEAQLPGRRKQGLALLSGGERSLTAAALIFALLKVSPTPFCVLDEVDAALDEANVGRFADLLRELSGETQFIVITHNRNTVQIADIIYGVTMGRDSTSQVISLKLEEVSQEIMQ